MIKSKKELNFYIQADYMMNRGYFKPSFKQRVKNIVAPDYIMHYLVAMRKVAFYSSCVKKYRSRIAALSVCVWGGILLIINSIKFRRLGVKLGLSIGCNVFGYGLVIPHYGTIVVGDNNKCGNYCVLHTSTCVSANGKVIGDAFYLSTGAKVTSPITIGDNVSVGANSVVNKDFDSNMMIAGAPAKFIKPMEAWYIRDGLHCSQRVESVEQLKKSMQL